MKKMLLQLLEQVWNIIKVIIIGSGKTAAFLIPIFQKLGKHFDNEEDKVNILKKIKNEIRV